MKWVCILRRGRWEGVGGEGRGCREEKHSRYQSIGISSAPVQRGMQTFRPFVAKKPFSVEECKGRRRPEGYWPIPNIPNSISTSPPFKPRELQFFFVPAFLKSLLRKAFYGKRDAGWDLDAMLDRLT